MKKIVFEIQYQYYCLLAFIHEKYRFIRYRTCKHLDCEESSLRLLTFHPGQERIEIKLKECKRCGHVSSEKPLNAGLAEIIM